MAINRGMDKEDVVCMYICVCVYIYTHTHTHTMQCYSAKEKNEIMCHNRSNMDGSRDCHTERRKSEKDKYYMISLYVDFKK